MDDREFYKLQSLIEVLDDNLLFDINTDKRLLLSIVSQFKKIDICCLTDYDKYYEDEYETYTAIRYHLNHFNSIVEDLNKLKENLYNIDYDNKELLNTILIKMTDINDIIDMIPEE